MKTFSLILLITTTLLSNELSWVDEQVEAIKPARIGMKTKSIAHIKDPFIFLSKNVTKKEKSSVKQVSKSSKSHTTLKKTYKQKKVLSLSIIVNKSAMINSKWYREGSIINGYKVQEITSNSVMLVKRNKKLLLSTKSNSKNLKFNNQ